MSSFRRQKAFRLFGKATECPGLKSRQATPGLRLAMMHEAGSSVFCRFGSFSCMKHLLLSLPREISQIHEWRCHACWKAREPIHIAARGVLLKLDLSLHGQWRGEEVGGCPLEEVET